MAVQPTRTKSGDQPAVNEAVQQNKEENESMFKDLRKTGVPAADVLRQVKNSLCIWNVIPVSLSSSVSWGTAWFAGKGQEVPQTSARLNLSGGAPHLKWSA